MRVGFITQLLWPRYGAFWQDLVAAVGAEAVVAEAGALVPWLADPRVRAVPGRAFQLAVAQALELQHCALIIAPELNPGRESARGSGQDPWIASFPEALAAQVAGLPPVFAVPSELGPELEPRAVELLSLLSRDPAGVRRVWERLRANARSPKRSELRWQRLPGEAETVGLVGQPWLLGERVLASLARTELHLIAQSAFDPALLRAEGWRHDERLLPTDAEVIGAARLLGRRGSVARLEFLHDPESGADLWLERQLRRLLHKPLSSLPLEALPDPTALVAL